MVIEGGGGAQPSQNVDGQSQYRYMFKFILNKQCNFSQTIPKKKRKIPENLNIYSLCCQVVRVLGP